MVFTLADKTICSTYNMTSSRKIRHPQTKKKKEVPSKNAGTKSRKCRRGVSDANFQPFEKALAKTPEYKNLSKLKEIEGEIIKRFKIPFSPAKVTPNNDFYTYINYRWLADTKKKMDAVEASQKYFVQVDDFRLLQDRVYKELIGIVQEYVKGNDSPRAQMVKNVYNSLVRLDAKPLQAHMIKMVTDYNDFVEKGNLWAFLAHINSNEIIKWGCPINWSVTADSRQSTTFRNNISFPQLSLYDYTLYIDDPTGRTHKESRFQKLVKRKFVTYINSVFDACLGKDHGLKGSDVFDAEYDIITALGCTSVKHESKDFYNVVQRHEALPKYGFDWEQFCGFLGYKVVPDFFICDSLSYLQCICKLLIEDDNWKTAKWRAYWFFIYLRQMIRFDHRLRELNYEFNEKFIKGQPGIFPKEIYPVFGLSVTFNTLLTNEYVKRNINYDTIAYVKNMAVDLIEVYKRIIRRNTWLSPKTKRYALLKLEHLDLQIARPQKLRYDPLLEYREDDAWGNLEKLCRWKTNKFLMLEGRDVIDIPEVDWSTFKLVGKQAYIVNAFYTPTENSIYIPQAYLQKPFIDLEERGIEYNLAYIGNTLGHEMSHSLDESGSKYDHKGNLKDWWTKEDKVKYKRIIRDIVKQYQVFASYDKITFDAEIGVGEDMADISGLAICEEYLRDFQMKNNDIVPISSLSFQEFFVYFAFQQRQHVYKKAFDAQLKTNPHPMDKYRTNVPLSRLKLFRSLYNVKEGDKMWWHTTSTIW
jgi:predicted metalloendopeptidase